MTEIKLETIKLKDIKPYAKNAKLHPTEQIAQIRDSILEDGYNDPIALDESNEIVEGHGRFEALVQIFMDMEKEIKIIRLIGLTEKQKARYRIRHNKLTQNTGFNYELMKEDFKLIDEPEFFQETGFSDFEVKRMQDQPVQDQTQAPEQIQNIGKLLITCPSCGHKFQKKDQKRSENVSS